MRRYVLPRLQDLLFVVIFTGALLNGQQMLNTDGDLGRHLSLGRFIVETHNIPTADVMSFTKSGQPRPPYEWLVQVLFAVAYRLMNLDGVVLLTSLVVTAAFIVVYRDARERSSTPVLALLITLWTALASSLHWLARPHVFSFVFFAIWLMWLEQLRAKDSRSLWKFPALMLIWANMHGGFILGFLAWGAYFADWLFGFLRRSTSWTHGRNLLIIGGTSLLASVLTPGLWHNWDAVLNNRSAYILSRTIETMPPDFSAPAVWPFVALLVLNLILLIIRKIQLAPSHLLLLGGLALLSLAMARNIPFFAIAAAPILTEQFSKLLDGPNKWLQWESGFTKIDLSLRGSFWSMAAILVAVSYFGFHLARAKSPVFQFSSEVFPVQAADWLQTHPPPPGMFNDFNWGGYLLYRLWPSQRVFIDSQSDFYGETFTLQYATVLAGEDNWQTILNQYVVQWIIVLPGSGLAEKARMSPLWRVAYEDRLAIIFVRR